MKVWHVTRTLYGGAGIYAQRLSDALRNVGVDSCTLSSDESAGHGARSLDENQSSLASFSTRVTRSLSHRLTSAPFHTLANMNTYSAEEMPKPGDVVHLHSLTGWMGLRGLKALIPDGVRVFWTVHDLWPLSGGCILYSGCDAFRSRCDNCPVLNYGFKNLAKMELSHKANFMAEYRVRLIANSSWIADQIRHSRVFDGVDEVPIVPPIIDPAYFESNIPDIRHDLQISDEKIVVSMGARAITDRYKGIPEFLTAIANRPRLAEQCIILLFGEGHLDFQETLDVRILGRLNLASEIAKVYSASDVFVSPSVMETFGMALAEAQACGTPVAAFDVGGVRDAVSDECRDFIVPNGDMELLLDAIESIAAKSVASERGWRVCRDWTKARFAPDVIGKRQSAIYEVSPSIQPRD